MKGRLWLRPLAVSRICRRDEGERKRHWSRVLQLVLFCPLACPKKEAGMSKVAH